MPPVNSQLLFPLSAAAFQAPRPSQHQQRRDDDLSYDKSHEQSSSSTAPPPSSPASSNYSNRTNPFDSSNTIQSQESLIRDHQILIRLMRDGERSFLVRKSGVECASAWVNNKRETVSVRRDSADGPKTLDDFKETYVGLGGMSSETLEDFKET